MLQSRFVANLVQSQLVVTMPTDHEFMEMALVEARGAGLSDEVPIGAVVAFEGRVVGRGRNRVEELADPTAHAEILALREAAHNLDRWRLTDCTLYVTLEPCAMCLGAAYSARVDKLVYGAGSPKFGALGSAVEIKGIEKLNHRLELRGGVYAEESANLLKQFFQDR
jgi:tRNA(adenine34) deaminase